MHGQECAENDEHNPWHVEDRFPVHGGIFPWFDYASPGRLRSLDGTRQTPH